MNLEFSHTSKKKSVMPITNAVFYYLLSAHRSLVGAILTKTKGSCYMSGPTVTIMRTVSIVSVRNSMCQNRYLESKLKNASFPCSMPPPLSVLVADMAAPGAQQLEAKHGDSPTEWVLSCQGLQITCR